MYACTGASPSPLGICGLPPERRTDRLAGALAEAGPFLAGAGLGLADEAALGLADGAALGLAVAFRVETLVVMRDFVVGMRSAPGACRISTLVLALLPAAYLAARTKWYATACPSNERGTMSVSQLKVEPSLRLALKRNR